MSRAILFSLIPFAVRRPGTCVTGRFRRALRLRGAGAGFLRLNTVTSVSTVLHERRAECARAMANRRARPAMRLREADRRSLAANSIAWRGASSHIGDVTERQHAHHKEDASP